MAHQSRGSTNYYAGRAAEDIVSDYYASRGQPMLAQRWRGTHGEIDLVAQNGDGVIFIEVKKSRSHGHAASRLSPHQLKRIYGAAEEFLATRPKGLLTDVRIDVALVDGLGRVEVIENVSLAA